MANGTAVLLTDALLYFVVGIALGTTLGFLMVRLPVRFTGRVLAVWWALVIVQYLSNYIEGLFFTSVFASGTLFLAAVIAALVHSGAESVVAGALFFPPMVDTTVRSELCAWFREWSLLPAAARIVSASVLYLPIYFFFGMLVSPFVLPYYLDPTAGLGLRIPPLPVMLPLELFRGFLYVGALLPLVAAMRANRWEVFVVTAALLYVAGAVSSILVSGSLPDPIRLPHALEILADSVAYAAVLTWLLARNAPADTGDPVLER
jgi:hypothetical protein